MSVVDDFVAGLEEPERATFERVRDLALRAVPGAEQASSYGLPALTWRGKPLLGFKVAASHLAVYPFSAAAVDAVRGRLDGFAVSKGTVRFTSQQPLPEQAVLGLVRARRDEIDARLG